MKFRLLLILLLLSSCDSKNIYFTTKGTNGNDYYDSVDFSIVTDSDTLHKKMDAFGIFLPLEENNTFRQFKIIGTERPDSLNEDRVNTITIQFPISFDMQLPFTINLESPINGEEGTVVYNEKLGEVLLDIHTFTRGTITITFFTPYRISGNFEVENKDVKLISGSFDLIGVYY